jgi:hypothetical protein
MRTSLPGALRLPTVLALLALIGALVGVAVARLPSPFWIVVGLVTLLLVLWQRYQSVSLVRAFRRTFGVEKDLLLVYTESPHWQPYIEQHWLPRWEARMVLFNRSRPWSKDQVEARLWRSVHRYGEHTPLAIIIPRGGDFRNRWSFTRRFAISSMESRNGSRGPRLGSSRPWTESSTSVPRNESGDLRSLHVGLVPPVTLTMVPR